MIPDPFGWMFALELGQIQAKAQMIEQKRLLTISSEMRKIRALELQAEATRDLARALNNQADAIRSRSFF
jgi:hypothetical protein